MESYGLEMDDLFDVGDVSQELNDFETVEENQGVSQQEEGANSTQNDDEEGDISRQVAERLKELGKGAAKKRVLRPQPKMDAARLTGERGIPILPKVFENVKYKGKGHEENDLNKMMGVMEHWAHRLFPRMPFDELIERTERLGQKKAVQVCVSKIRLDMPLLDNDFVRQISDDEEAPPADATADHDPVDIDVDQPADQEPASQILDEEEEALDDILQQEREDSSHRVVLTASTPYPKPSHGLTTLSGLTPQQMERIRENQEKARLMRLNKSAASSSGTFNQTQLEDSLMEVTLAGGDRTAADKTSPHTSASGVEMETDLPPTTEVPVDDVTSHPDVTDSDTNRQSSDSNMTAESRHIEGMGRHIEGVGSTNSGNSMAPGDGNHNNRDTTQNAETSNGNSDTTTPKDIDNSVSDAIISKDMNNGITGTTPPPSAPSETGTSLPGEGLILTVDRI